MIGRVGHWVDDRLGLSAFARRTLRKVFPDHWSFLLGEVALYSFLMLVITGIFLTFFFKPSLEQTTYQGSYDQLRGVPMSEAYHSAVRLSFDVRAGLVMRQIHHWAALVFLGAIFAHLCRVFFTGAFRKPRELNWLVGVTLLLLALVNGFFGYSLLDDLLSGTGLRIMYSVVLAVPIVGTWAAFLIFGGEFPAHDIITRLFVLHVLLVPAAIAVLLTAHLMIIWKQKHTQFPGPGRREDNVVGTRLWPTYTAKSVGLFFLVAAVLCALGGLVQINPVWLYGPFEPSAVTTAAQPDWYMGWLEGALRLFPAWSFRIGPFTISELFWPAVLLPGLTFALLYAWPFLEQWRTKDYAEHHLLSRPRDSPARTAIGLGTFTFYFVLFLAGSQDVISQVLHVDVVAVYWCLRILLVVLPPVVGFATYKFCRQLAEGTREEAIRRTIEDAERERHPIPALAAASVVRSGGSGGSGPSEPSEPSWPSADPPPH
jgi:ubiquinol-cytochrome c reductase cytochrome b subunit